MLAADVVVDLGSTNVSGVWATMGCAGGTSFSFPLFDQRGMLVAEALVHENEGLFCFVLVTGWDTGFFTISTPSKTIFFSLYHV